MHLMYLTHLPALPALDDADHRRRRAGPGRKPRQRWAADVLCEPRCGFRDAIRKETEPHGATSRSTPEQHKDRSIPFSYALFGRALSLRGGIDVINLGGLGTISFR